VRKTQTESLTGVVHVTSCCLSAYINVLMHYYQLYMRLSFAVHTYSIFMVHFGTKYTTDMLGAILQISKCYIFAITQTAMQRVESVQELLGLGSQKMKKSLKTLNTNET